MKDAAGVAPRERTSRKLDTALLGLIAPSSRGVARFRCRSSGQVLVFFVLMLPILLAGVVLVLEVANLFLVRRDAQGAADLAALVAARSLPTNPAKARGDALALAAANGYPSGEVVATTPYGGSDTRIEVVITTTVRSIVLPLVGGETVPVDARAVAVNSSVTLGSYAIFALHDACRSGEPEKAIDWSGSSDTVNGSIHSRSGMTVSGADNIVGAGYPITYECAGLYSETGNNPGIRPRASPEPCPGLFEDTPCLRSEEPPLEYDWGTFNTSPNFACDWIRASGDFDLAADGSWWDGGSKSSKRLRAGKYCAPSGAIKLAESGVTVIGYMGRSGVTFVADKVDVSGSDYELTPYDRRVIAFANSDQPDALKFGGSTGAYTGLLYAPSGTVEMSESTNSTLLGGIIADRVRINGSSLTINGTIGERSGGYQYLVE